MPAGVVDSPVRGHDRGAGGPYDDLLGTEPTPLQADVRADGDPDESAELRLLVNALESDEDTPRDVLARAQADLARAQGEGSGTRSS